MSMDIIFDAYNVLLDDSKRDPELKDWGRNVRAYIRKVCPGSRLIVRF